MVLKTQICRYSGLRLYPGKGSTFVRIDGQQYLLMGSKCRSLFHQKLRPAKIAWTAMYRKQHKKDQTTDASKRKRRTHQKVTLRSIVGASLEVIQKKRNEKPEVRQAAREAALREVKERMRKQKETKKAASGPRGGGKFEKGSSKGGKGGRAVNKGAGGLR